MGAYNYKYVRDQLPPYITEEIADYEAGCDYDGDMWVAASDYMVDLEQELFDQYAITKTIANKKLLNWLKTRNKTSYADNPKLED